MCGVFVLALSQNVLGLGEKGWLARSLLKLVDAHSHVPEGRRESFPIDGAENTSGNLKAHPLSGLRIEEALPLQVRFPRAERLIVSMTNSAAALLLLP